VSSISFGYPKTSQSIGGENVLTKVRPRLPLLADAILTIISLPVNQSAIWSEEELQTALYASLSMDE